MRHTTAMFFAPGQAKKRARKGDGFIFCGHCYPLEPVPRYGYTTYHVRMKVLDEGARGLELKRIAKALLHTLIPAD